MNEILNSLNEWGLLKISGMDAKKLLQGQVTCDVMQISEEKSSLGAHCNPQGRVISLFYLFLWKENYYLLMPRTLISMALNALKKYAVFYKVDMTDVSHQFIILGVQKNQLNSINSNDIAIIPNVDSNRCYVIGEESVIKSIAPSISTMNGAEWKLADIEARIPTIYPETSGKFLPHEINLDQLHAISFDKGCYTGQEIIARMHYRGKLKTHLYLGQIQREVPLHPGSDISAQENQKIYTVGTVVDSAQKEYNVVYTLITASEADAKNEHLFFAPEERNFFTLLNT